MPIVLERAIVAVVVCAGVATPLPQELVRITAWEAALAYERLP